MIIYGVEGKPQEIEGCIGCACASGEFDVFGGNLFETESFIVAQDCELPINGFMIVSTKRHITKMTELSEKEQIDLIKIIIMLPKNIILFLKKKAHHIFMFGLCQDINGCLKSLERL